MHVHFEHGHFNQNISHCQLFHPVPSPHLTRWQLQKEIGRPWHSDGTSYNERSSLSFL
jgi:hypothetical protein